MGPCPQCGQQTETDADFCPACAGYPAPATVYSYAPGRLGQDWDDAPAPRLADVPRRRRFPDESASDLAYSPQPADIGPALPVRYSGRHNGRWIALAAAVTVVLVAAGSVALALARDSGHGSPPTAGAARPSRSVSPATPSAAATPGGEVTVAPAVAGAPHQAAVLAFMNSYFTAINEHDYAAYQQLFSPAVRGAQSATDFSAGYGSTTDSGITLLSIGTVGVGELVAQVSFTSRQQPSGSPTNSSCSSWTISLYLLAQNNQYELVPPPTGYQPSYAACS